MIDKLNFDLTFVSALGSGLIAGFFLAFSIVVMKSLGQHRATTTYPSYSLIGPHVFIKRYR